MQFKNGRVFHAVVLTNSSPTRGQSYYWDNQFPNKQRLACKSPNWGGGVAGYTVFRLDEEKVTCKSCLKVLA